MEDSNYGLGAQPDIADLNSMTPEQLRELADFKEKRVKVQPMIDGLRELADLIEAHHDALRWTTRTVSLDYMHGYRDDEAPVEWVARVMVALGGDWREHRPLGLTDYLVMRRVLGAASDAETPDVVLDLTIAREELHTERSDLERAIETKMNGEDVQLGASLHVVYADDEPEKEEPELSPNHPASGNLTPDEFDESGYDGPMADRTGRVEGGDQ